MRRLAAIAYLIILTTALLLWYIIDAHRGDAHSESAPPATSEPIVEPEVVVTSDTIRLIFGGDFMQHKPQVDAARSADGSYDYTSSIEYVAPIFQRADVAVVNLETTITTSGYYTGYPCFSSPVEVVDALVDMGIDIALLANNHCCDKFSRGINTTIEELERRHIVHTGVFRDSLDYANNNIYRFAVRGVRFALLNYTYGTNGIPVPDGKIVNLINDDIITRDLRSINRDSVDCVIACMHWGNEYERKQNREQERLAELLRREGVDIIIGGHPHVVQPYQADSSHVVFYSLGNLVSNQQRRYCDGGIIAEVEVIRCDTVDGLRYRAQDQPVYVICPGYKITPRAIGDTLPMSESLRHRYTQFMSDTDENLATSRR